eukprot:gi/632953992/ref/XP_007892724.1/ PREDICTED: uncharacterized protein LOC103179316 [Callorhinchus milii]
MDHSVSEEHNGITQDPKHILVTENPALIPGLSSGLQNQVVQGDVDKANGPLDPSLYNELNQQSVFYRNWYQVQSEQQGHLMRQQMEHLQHLMDQQQKLMKLLSLPPASPENCEQPTEQSIVSPFGIERNPKRTGGPEERPIRPGISVRQKTFEDFVEEQLKVDSESVKQDSQNVNEVKATTKKSFLKRGEGIARFEKNKDIAPKEQSVCPIKESAKQSPWKVTFGSHRRLSLPALSEGDSLQVKKRPALKKQVSTSVLLSSKAKKPLPTNSSMMSGSKDHRQHDKLDEIKNSTDEGIQSDINAPELMNKFELSCKHCNDRNNACQHLKEGIKTVGGNSEEETQGHAPGSKSLNFHILECQNLIQFESNLPNQSSNHVLPESITKLNQEQHVWQSQESVNELSMPFNTSSYLACSLEQQNSNRDGVVKQDIALFQEQIEKEQGDKRNNADSSKGLDRKKVGFKKLNDQIVQVDGLLYCSENVQNQEVQDGEMHRDTSTGLILHTNNEQNGLIIGFKSKNEHHRTAHTKASSTDTEDDDPKSQCHQQLTKETAQKYNHIDNHLDLSDDADYASDLPSGLEDLEVNKGEK